MKNFKTKICFLFISFNLVLSAIDFNKIVKQIPKANGHEYLNKTLRVTGYLDFKFKEIELYDKCREQAENQQAVITIGDGGHIKNLIIGFNSGNGIICDGDCIIENVHWRDVCEDGATFKDKGNSSSKVMNIIGGSAYEAEDKLFQHNSAGKMIIRNFYAKNIGKLSRSCGTCYTRDFNVSRTFEVENVVVDGLKSAIVGLQLDKNDRALVLKNIQVKNAKKFKNGTLSAGICTGHLVRSNPPGGESLFSATYIGNGPFPNACNWESDVTID